MRRTGDADGDIAFVGDFTPAERALLGGQFGRCRFELIRRASGDRTRAVVAWSAAGRPPSRGPAPLRPAPTAAVYVLRRTELVRVGTREELERVFGEPLGDLSLPGLARRSPIWDGAIEALRGLIPWK